MYEVARGNQVTLGGAALEKARALCRSVGAESRFELLRETLELFGQGWFDRPVGDAPPFRNDITDDGSPFEFSLAFAGEVVELRLLAEAQRAPFNIASNWKAGTLVHKALVCDPNVDIARFASVAELFEPRARAAGSFAIWHAASIDEAGRRSFKLYLNPQLRGRSKAPDIVREALSRLGYEAAWPRLQARLSSNAGAEPIFFSLDLARGACARVKIYLAHHAATAADLDLALCGTRGYAPGDAQRWIETMTGLSGPFTARPLLSCFSFVDVEETESGTLHIPVRCYTGSDADVLACLSSLLPVSDVNRLRDALTAMSGRALHTGRGLVTYVSLRREREHLRVTTYIAPQLYAIASPRMSVLPASRSVAPMASFVQAIPVARRATGLTPTMLTVQDAIAREQQEFGRHPFLQRLEAGASLAAVRAMTEGMTFFVLVFQDVLRLARQTITDPRLTEIAGTHEREDHGHEQWFLSDAARLGAARDLRWVFSPEHVAARDASYALVAEVLRASHDCARMAVVLVLETLGAVFFGRVIALLERLGQAEGLRYFARLHQQVEQAHDVFEHATQQQLLSIELPGALLEETLRATERSFAAMRALGDDLNARMAAADPLVAAAS